MPSRYSALHTRRIAGSKMTRTACPVRVKPLVVGIRVTSVMIVAVTAGPLLGRFPIKGRRRCPIRRRARAMERHMPFRSGGGRPGRAASLLSDWRDDDLGVGETDVAGCRAFP